MYREIEPVEFPEAANLSINMMPIIMGDADSVPWYLRQYLPLIEKCQFKKGTTVYLSVEEGVVAAGDTQRRAGVHTDGGSDVQWGGGGNWGGGSSGDGLRAVPQKGIYLASTNGYCRLWNCVTWMGDEQGSLPDGWSRHSFPPEAEAVVTQPNTLYWLTDRTPHESLPQEEESYRQWFRLVADEIGIWYGRHSTPNPLGVVPNAPVTWEDKFAQTS